MILKQTSILKSFVSRLHNWGIPFSGGGSGKTAKPIVETVLMDYTGKINGATISVEVSYSGSDWLFVTSWRAIGLTRCKLS